MDQLERPQYYEGEYLSADDLAAIVRYARTGQAQHALAAHVWGLAIGLELVERPLTGDDVEMVLTPGIAWDGHARTLVALAPQRLSLDLFADFQDTTVPAGVPIEIWLTYRELAAKPPGVGFACPDDDLHGRVVETFRIEVRRSPITDYHSVTIAGRSIEAQKALTTFDASKPILFDESVPAQTFPDSGDRQRWPIFVGIVRWRMDAGQPGRLIRRIDDDRNATRKGRRYIGAVAETILAPDGVLRLRDRSKDPADPALNYTPPIVAAPGGTTVVNDLVWCEGHLRVVGDTRLQTGKLDYRVARGGNDGVPVYLRRILVNAPVMKTTLDAFVGRPAPLPAPVNAQTRFTVSTGDPANATECLTVVTDGRVGVNAAEPSNTLQVNGPTGIRYGFGYVTGDAGAGWTAFAFNAYNPPGGPWIIPDAAHRPAAIVLDDAGGVPELKLQTSPTGNPAVWNVHVVVKGNTGNVGIGTTAPVARLHVAGTNHLNTVFDLTDAPEHLTIVVGTVGSGLRFSNTNEFFIASQPYANRGDNTFGAEHLRIKANGNTGIGTATPRTKLEVAGNADQFGTAVFGAAPAKGPHLSHIHWDPTGDWYIRSAATAGKVVIQDTGGNTGIGTSNPQTKLNVVGNRIRLGDAVKRIDLRTDGSAVDLHSETHDLYIRTLGDALHPGQRNVLINPSAQEGNVGIGTAAPTSKLHVNGDLRVNGSAYKTTIGGWTFVSDRRLKKDIQPIEEPLGRLLGLRGLSFTWREPARVGAGPGTYVGFVAQDVEKVFPEWVTTTPEGEKAINPAGLEALFVEAIRELSGRTERLESEVADLRARLERYAKGGQPQAPTAAATPEAKAKPRRSRKQAQ
jgi:hypothetical protein